MSLLRNAAFAAAVSLAGAAPASAAFVFDGGVAPKQIARVDAQAASAAAESYFDYDALLTLGVLAIAGGALAGVGAARGRNDAERDPEWRESVFRALQADLAEYSESYRHAA